MRLKALQGLDHEKLEAEYKELQEKIRYFLELLADENKLKGVLREELIAIRDKFGDERKTEIQELEDEIDIEDLIACRITSDTSKSQAFLIAVPLPTLFNGKMFKRILLMTSFHTPSAGKTM